MISRFGPEQMINGSTDSGENEGEAGLVWGLEIDSSILTTLSL